MQGDEANRPKDEPEADDDLGDEGEEDSLFEEQLIDALADIVENGIPVGVSLDEDSTAPIRSVSDAVHKNTAAVREQTKVMEQQNKLLETLVSLMRSQR